MPAIAACSAFSHLRTSLLTCSISLSLRWWAPSLSIRTQTEWLTDAGRGEVERLQDSQDGRATEAQRPLGQVEVRQERAGLLRHGRAAADRIENRDRRSARSCQRALSRQSTAFRSRHPAAIT